MYLSVFLKYSGGFTVIRAVITYKHKCAIEFCPTCGKWAHFCDAACGYCEPGAAARVRPSLNRQIRQFLGLCSDAHAVCTCANMCNQRSWYAETATSAGSDRSERACTPGVQAYRVQLLRVQTKMTLCTKPGARPSRVHCVSEHVSSYQRS